MGIPLGIAERLFLAHCMMLGLHDCKVGTDVITEDTDEEYLVMEASARVRTLHPAVTGKEGAAPAEAEAVLSILA